MADPDPSIQTLDMRSFKWNPNAPEAVQYLQNIGCKLDPIIQRPRLGSARASLEVREPTIQPGWIPGPGLMAQESWAVCSESELYGSIPERAPGNHHSENDILWTMHLEESKAQILQNP